MKIQRSPRFSILYVWALMISACITVFAQASFSKEQQTRQIKGTLVDKIYTSPRGDFRVKVPNSDMPGATLRDEGEDEIWQVIFTDDFGGFYRMLSLQNRKTKYDPERVLKMEVYAGAFDREVVNTVRGREVRFIDVEKEGAEITITKSRKLADGTLVWDSKTPDLVTANAAFEVNEHLYHVIVGIPRMEKMDQETAVKRAKEGLEKFLAGLEFVESRK